MERILAEPAMGAALSSDMPPLHWHQRFAVDRRPLAGGWKGNPMQVTRRSALIAGTIAAVAASGILMVGPAVARDRGPSAPGGNHMGGMMGGMMDGDRGMHRGPAVE